MPDLLVILLVALVAVVFWRGPKTLPKLGEALGRGFREARREATDLTNGADAATPTTESAADDPARR